MVFSHALSSPCPRTQSGSTHRLARWEVASVALEVAKAGAERPRDSDAQTSDSSPPCRRQAVPSAGPCGHSERQGHRRRGPGSRNSPASALGPPHPTAPAVAMRDWSDRGIPRSLPRPMQLAAPRPRLQRRAASRAAAAVRAGSGTAVARPGGAGRLWAGAATGAGGCGTCWVVDSMTSPPAMREQPARCAAARLRPAAAPPAPPRRDARRGC